MKKLIKPIIGIIILVAIFCFSLVQSFKTGFILDIKSSISGPAKNLDNDFTALKTLNHSILLVKEKYINPERIQPKKMLIKALEEVQRLVPELLIDHLNEKSKSLTVHVGDKVSVVSIEPIEHLWSLSLKLKEILAFVQSHMTSPIKKADLEYATINGILSTLDPHTILMSPEIYNELKLGNKGDFGGLGIVISIRDGELTVISPIEDTPAFKVGLKPNDVIIKIDQESTVNMSLLEAVNRLRGKPGTKVRIWVKRKTWLEPRKFELERAIIKINSVYSNLLPGQIGYIKLKNFQNNTCRDMRAALKEWQKKAKLKGLILDLRNNPGGLLSQAIDVSDTFLSKGIIVTTVGEGNKLRDERKATGKEVEANYPIIVLVNAGSASASEIVAGALKNQNRAIIMGENTFGKGSVQVLYPFKDDSALKLTVSQYLTPGDISIQSVGITPDIRLVPAIISSTGINFYVQSKYYKEKDLESHLENINIRKDLKPYETIYFIEEDKEKDAEESLIKMKFKMDYPIKLAYNILMTREQPGRYELLESIKGLIQKESRQEFSNIVKLLKKQNINWEAGKSNVVPVTAAEFSTDKPDNIATAGEKIHLTITVKNNSQGTLYRLRGMTFSENPMFKYLEFFIGKLGPTETKSFKVPVKIPKHQVTQTVPVFIKFHEMNGHQPKSIEGQIQIKGLKHPSYAYQYTLMDECEKCNHDGLIQSGEEITLRLRIQNQGKGAALNSTCTIKNLIGSNIFIKKGRASLKGLKPGEYRIVEFQFNVSADLKPQTYPLELTFLDYDLYSVVTKKIFFKVEKDQGIKGKPVNDTYQVRGQGDILKSPTAGAQVIGSIPTGSIVKCTWGANNYCLAAYENKELNGWISMANLEKASSEKIKGVVEIRSFHFPVIAYLKAKEAYTGQAQVPLSFKLSDKTGLKDCFLFVNNKKVFYQRFHKASHFEKLDLIVPLKKGANKIELTVINRSELNTQQLIFIYRQGKLYPEEI